jgi:high affinity sulfate transporter 1
MALLRPYRLTWLRRDLIAGATVAAYLVPQVMAYATVAGLPPVAGLWAILAPLAVYALLGTSRQLSVGPESTTALLTATVIAPLAAGQPGRYAVLCATLAVVVGLLGVIGFVARLGVVADLLSRPVLVGYLAGVAVTMIVGQLGRLTGVKVSGNTFLIQLTSFVRDLSQAQASTMFFAAAVLAFLLIGQWRAPHLPMPLLAVLLATTAVAVFNLRNHGIGVVGPIPQGLPTPVLPRPGDLTDLILPAVGVLVVGYSDTILTARSFAARGRTRVDANRELLAVGVANVGAGLLRGFPISSSGSRTALAAGSGARSQVYSLTTLGLVVIVLLVGGPVLALFPTAALGAIVVFAAVRLIDLAGFRRLYTFRRNELILALATLVGVLVFDVLYGVLLAIALSVAEMLLRIARPHDAIQGMVPDLAGMHDIDDYPEARTIPGLLVYRYDSPLFFANAEDFRSRALAAVAAQNERVSWFVLNVEANVEVDITALDSLEQLRSDLVGRGIVFAFARVKRDLLDDLEAYGLAAAVGRDRLFPTLPAAVAAYEEWRNDKPAT